MKEPIILGLMLGILHGSAQAASVVPNFTRGTVTSETTTTQTITEIMNVVEYSTGTTYTVTGTNINFPINPAPGADYTLIEAGAPFQFSETFMGPGIAKETYIERTTTTNSITNSLSVFTQ